MTFRCNKAFRLLRAPAHLAPCGKYTTPGDGRDGTGVGLTMGRGKCQGGTVGRELDDPAALAPLACDKTVSAHNILAVRGRSLETTAGQTQSHADLKH